MQFGKSSTVDEQVFSQYSRDLGDNEFGARPNETRKQKGRDFPSRSGSSSHSTFPPLFATIIIEQQ